LKRVSLDGRRLAILDWPDVSKLCLKLWLKASGRFNPDLVVAVLKGGFPVGLWLASLYGKPLAFLQIKHYRWWHRRSKPVLLRGLSFQVEGLRVLLVDDVVDSGETLKLAFSHLKLRKVKALKAAVLHVKPWRRFQPDYYVKETADWIVYPWEKQELLLELLREGKASGKFLEKLGLEISRSASPRLV